MEQVRLKQLQSSVTQIAHSLHVREIGGQYDFRAIVPRLSDGITMDIATATLQKDGIITIVSPVIAQDHFNPYQLAVFAASQLNADALRTQLLSWIEAASSALHLPPADVAHQPRHLLSWYGELSTDNPQEDARLEQVAQIAALVTQFFHPQATAQVRQHISSELYQRAARGIREATAVIELLASQLSTGIDLSHMRVRPGDIAGVPANICFRLVEEAYEAELKQLSLHQKAGLPFSSVIRRLVRKSDHGASFQITIASATSDIFAVYCVYLLLAQRLNMLEMENVQLGIGVSDSPFYFSTKQRYVAELRRWFNSAHQTERSLAHLVRCATHNDLQALQTQSRNAYHRPSNEDLVLFYLKALSPLWRSRLIAKFGDKDTLKEFTQLIKRMYEIIPQSWRSSIDNYFTFSRFIRRAKPHLTDAIDGLQPINLLTDNQIERADLIIAVSHHSKNQIVRRFTAGAAQKTFFLGNIGASSIATNCVTIKSPYSPPSFFFEPRWHSAREKFIANLLDGELISTLRQVSRGPMSLIRLVELKLVSKEAIAAVQEYVLNLQRRAASGQDHALMQGLLFLLAVKLDVEPSSSEWQDLVTRYQESRESLQDKVFEGKSRTLADYIAIQFLRHYLGPKKYVNREFPGVYQEYNETMLDRLVVRCRSNDAINYQRN